MAVLTAKTRIENLYQSLAYRMSSSSTVSNFFTAGAFQAFLASEGSKYDLQTLDTAIGELDVSGEAKGVLQALSQIHSAVESELSTIQIGTTNYIDYTITESVGGGTLSYKFDRDPTSQNLTPEVIRDRLLSFSDSSQFYSSTVNLANALLNILGDPDYEPTAVDTLDLAFSSGVTAGVYADANAIKSTINTLIQDTSGTGETLKDAIADALEKITIGATQEELEAKISSKVLLINAVSGTGYTESSLATALFNAMSGLGTLTLNEVLQDINRLVITAGSPDSLASVLLTEINSANDDPASLAAAIAAVTINPANSISRGNFLGAMTDAALTTAPSITSAIGPYDISDLGETLTSAILALDNKARLDDDNFSAGSFTVCLNQGVGTADDWQQYTVSGSVTDISLLVKGMFYCNYYIGQFYQHGYKDIGILDGSSCVGSIDPGEVYTRCMGGLVAF